MLRGRDRRSLRRVNIEPGDVAIDVGANVGGATEFLASRGAMVYAFEPQPEVFRELHDRMSIHSRVACIQAAAWIENGTIDLYCHPKETEAASVYEGKRNVTADCKLSVATVDLAEFIVAHGPIKLLYINAEGAEYELVLHLIKTGAIDRVEHVLVQPHSHKIAGIEDVVEAARKMAAERGIKLK